MTHPVGRPRLVDLVAVAGSLPSPNLELRGLITDAQLPDLWILMTPDGNLHRRPKSGSIQLLAEMIRIPISDSKSQMQTPLPPQKIPAWVESYARYLDEWLYNPTPFGRREADHVDPLTQLQDLRTHPKIPLHRITTWIQTVDANLAGLRRQKELLMHRILRFREMFQIYCQERGPGYPVKTFGLDIINTDPEKIIHRWYTADPQNLRLDLAFYERAAQRFKTQMASPDNDLGVSPYTGWNSGGYNWLDLAIQSMQLNLEDYELVRNSNQIYHRYHADNYPLYNPEYVIAQEMGC